jgi:hypothetical protein
VNRVFGSWVLLGFFLCPYAHGDIQEGSSILSGPNFLGKKVIRLEPVTQVQIEMPDQSLHDFGQDFQASLTTQLIHSGKYLLQDDSQESGQNLGLQAVAHNQLFSHSTGGSTDGVPDPYVWDGSSTPVADVKISVDALSFSTGEGGDRMFYGFDEHLRNAFNDGSSGVLNEFPLRALMPGVTNWFDQTFDPRGVVPWDSQSGLDLGDGFALDALMAWLNVKYAAYHARLHLRLELIATQAPLSVVRPVEVKAAGFFFDVVGGYQYYSAGIAVARTDAMQRALASAIANSYGAMDRALSPLPLLAKVDAILNDGTILMGVGPGAQVPAGTVYQVGSSTLVRVDESVSSGAIGHLIQGDLASLSLGALMVQTQDASPAVAESNLVDSLQLTNAMIPQLNLSGWVPVLTRAQAFLMSIVGEVVLPYRIYRYFKYDQEYDSKAAGSASGSNRQWSQRFFQQSWAQKVGISQGLVNAPDSAGPVVAAPVIAVIDSGVDYNHSLIRNSVWLNPSPFTDPQGRQDLYGWDFISGDDRPFDDGYHGTEVSSVVLAIAPQAQIMALKVFNPWGVTDSASIFGAFQYAVDHGAHLILCAWATSLSSQAMVQGVSYADDHGVPVVAAAGDVGQNLAVTPYFPAVLALQYDNILSVTGVDAQDQLLSQSHGSANFDSHSVLIAAPAADIPVAQPREQVTHDSSTGLASALVAGALARYWVPHTDYHFWLQSLLNDADSVDGLREFVQNGRRLHLKR